MERRSFLQMILASPLVGLLKKKEELKVADLLECKKSLPFNVALGYQALYSNTDGYQNTAIGKKALFSNTTGNENFALGTESLYTNTTGSGNIAIGNLNLRVSNSSNNVAIGTSVLKASTGLSNIGIGTTALTANTTADYNIAIGTNALAANLGGGYNIAIGHNSMLLNTAGTGNVAIGYGALQPVTAYQNTAIGHYALNSTTSANENVAVGYQAGSKLTTGDSNILIGYRSGYYETAASHKFIVDNRLRGAAGVPTNSTLSLLYGTMADTVADQTLRINARTTISNTATPQLNLIHTAGVDETSFYTNADGQLIVMPTSRTMYLGDGTDGDNELGFYSDTSLYTLHHDEDNSALKVSANDTTNYAQFGADGELTLAGTARVNVELDLPLTDFNPGASGPTPALHGIYPSYEFSLNDDMHTSIEIPTDWDSSTDITIEIYWAINEAYVTNSGEVQWYAVWNAVAVGESVAAPTHTGTIDFGDVDIPAAANTLVKTTGTISAASLSAQDVLALNGSRVALDGGSNPAAEPYIIAFRMEYVANKLGEAS